MRPWKDVRAEHSKLSEEERASIDAAVKEDAAAMEQDPTRFGTPGCAGGSAPAGEELAAAIARAEAAESDRDAWKRTAQIRASLLDGDDKPFREEIAAAEAELAEARRVAALPIDMVLHCPKCHLQHVDASEPGTEWTNPPHKSHKCHGCGTVWRPADVATNGVASIQTRGKADSWTGPAALTGKEGLEAAAAQAERLRARLEAADDVLLDWIDVHGCECEPPHDEGTCATLGHPPCHGHRLADAIGSAGQREEDERHRASEQPRAAPVDPSDSAPPEGLKDLGAEQARRALESGIHLLSFQHVPREEVIAVLHRGLVDSAGAPSASAVPATQMGAAAVRPGMTSSKHLNALYFGDLCDALFPESAGKPSAIGWPDLIVRARALVAGTGHTPTEECGCIETWPQLQPGKINHGPGCARHAQGDRAAPAAPPAVPALPSGARQQEILVADQRTKDSGAPPASPDARDVLTELLRLYDWRFELGEREKDPLGDKKLLSHLLRQYGTEKKAAWEAARRVLAGSEAQPPPDARVPDAAAALTPFDRLCADALADEVAVLVQRRVIDSRSPAADALLDYRNPPSSPRADRLAELEQLVCDFQAAAMIDVNGRNGPCEVTPAHVEKHVTELRARIAELEPQIAPKTPVPEKAPAALRMPVVIGESYDGWHLALAAYPAAMDTACGKKGMPATRFETTDAARGHTFCIGCLNAWPEPRVMTSAAQPEAT